MTEPKCEWIIGHKEASKEVIHEVVSPSSLKKGHLLDNPLMSLEDTLR